MNNQIDGRDDYSIVVKVGSNVLYGEETGIDIQTVQNIVNGIEYLMFAGIQVFLVTSGAVAIGRKILERAGYKFGKDLSPDEQAFCASVGHPKLISLYIALFEQKRILTSQILLTHNHLFSEVEKRNTLDVLNRTRKGVIAIINENDVVSREELAGTKFSDNDGLAGSVAKLVGAQHLLVLSDVDGVYENHGQENERLIEEVDITNIEMVKKHISQRKSLFGRGGLESKVKVLEDLARHGIQGIIADGKKPNIIQSVFGTGEHPRTIFKTSK